MNAKFDPDDLYSIIERLIQLTFIAVVVVGAVFVAASLTRPVTTAIAAVPRAIGRFGTFLWNLTSVPWQQWLVFPFVLAFVLVVFWFLWKYDQRDEKTHLRGRRLLSADEAQRIAARQAKSRSSTKPHRGRS